MIAFFSLAAAAEPATELALQMGTLPSDDPAYDLFHDGDGMPLPGLRLGYRPVERVAVELGWAALRTGARVEVAGGPDFVAAMTAHQLRLGAKADLGLADGALRPSVALAGLAMPATWRLDGTPRERDRDSEVRAGAASVGVEALGGLEVRVPTRNTWTVGAHLQVGYAWLTALDFGDLGAMRLGGPTVRGGFGLHF